MASEQTTAYLQAAMQGLTTIFAKCGIVLLVAPVGAPKGARVNYVSNCDRAEMIAMMKEVVARFEGRSHDAPESKQ